MQQDLEWMAMLLLAESSTHLDCIDNSLQQEKRVIV